jgi:hypothetical protein
MKKLFQFQLSTLVVLMFLAGGQIWLNVSPTSEPQEGKKFPTIGWPIAVSHAKIKLDDPRKYSYQRFESWRYPINISLNIFIFVGSAFLIDWITKKMLVMQKV